MGESVWTSRTGFSDRIDRIDTALNPWIERFKSILPKLYPHLVASVAEAAPAVLAPRVELQALDGVTALTHQMDGAGISASGQESALFEVTLKSMTRITREDWYQDVRHIELQAEDDILCALSFP